MWTDFINFCHKITLCLHKISHVLNVCFGRKSTGGTKITAMGIPGLRKDLDWFYLHLALNENLLENILPPNYINITQILTTTFGIQ